MDFFIIFLLIMSPYLYSAVSSSDLTMTTKNRILHGLQFQNCSISVIDTEIRDRIETLLEDGKKLIFIHILLEDIKLFPDEYNGDMYKPMDWVRTSGRHGRSLLFLRPHFEHLSLSTLSFETERISVVLSQSPKQCLSLENATVFQARLRELLLSEFKAKDQDGSLSEHEHICNMHIKNDNSRAQFYYICCHKGPDGHLFCQDMLFDYWINLVFVCMFLINFVVIMYSPSFIPESFYRKQFGQNVYEHTLVKPLEIRIKKLIKTVNRKEGPCVQIGKSHHMHKLYSLLKTLQANEVLKLSLSKIDIAVKNTKLVPANYVPVGVMQTFHSMFIKCNIRKTGPFKRCCKGNIFVNPLNRFSKSKISNRKETKEIQKRFSPSNDKGQQTHPWHKYLRRLMRVFVLLTVALPWIIRVYFSERHEKSEVIERKRAAKIRNMSLPFQWNLTNTLTPFHAVFIVCYAIFVLDALVLGAVSHRIKTKLQYLMRKCLRDMREISRSKAIEWSILILVVPCEVCGIFGFVLTGFYLVFAIPIIIVVLSFYCLSTVNLTIRLLAHFFAYLMPYGRASNKRFASCENFRRIIQKYFYTELLMEKNFVQIPGKMSARKRFGDIFILVVCLFTVFSFVLLALEVITFGVEIFIYTIIGIIMNASSVLKYITLIFMLVFYARDCFKCVSDKYLDFNKSINRLVIDMNRPKVEAIASLGSHEQRNTAFQICTEKDTSVDEETEMDIKNIKLVVKDGIPKWWARRLILFLDNNDKPYLTKKFFMSACYMKTVGVPGPLIYNLLRALSRFFCICAFLMFVILIVVAFGDEYQISGTNQMLATLAGGFLPWVLRNILFKAKDKLSLDTNNLSFKSGFKTKIEEYEQCWDISDFEINENNYQIIEDKEFSHAHESYELQKIELHEKNLAADNHDEILDVSPMLLVGEYCTQNPDIQYGYDLIVVDNEKETFDF